jgi:hypothetical protein
VEEQQIQCTQPWSAIAIIVAADDAQRRLWAIRGAVAIARRLAQGHKVLLADLECSAPSVLAAVLNVEKGPGVVDVFFRGASFATAARRPEGEPFLFLPSGDEPPPLANIYDHTGWAKIARCLRSNNAIFLACASADDWLEAGPIPGFEACMVLNANEGSVRLPPGARRIAEVVAPPGVRQSRRRDTGLPDRAMPRSDVAIQAVASGGASGARGQEVQTQVADHGGEEPPGGPSSALDRRVIGFPSGPGLVLYPAKRRAGVRRRHRRKRRLRKMAVKAAVTAALVLAAALSVWLGLIAGSCRARAAAHRVAAESSGWEADPANADRIEAERVVRGEAWSCLISEVESRLLHARRSGSR